MTEPEVNYYTHSMNSTTQQPLGVLLLERGHSTTSPPPPPVRGSLRNPDTFEFPVISETVKGAWVENVVSGDQALEPAFVEAALRLVERGAVAITSTCGFSIRHQAAVAASVSVPVAMSSLLVLPALLRQTPAPRKIAVLTYDSNHVGEDLLGLESSLDRSRVVVGGIEGGKFWRDELMRPAPPIDLDAIENDVSECIDRLRTSNPDIAAILLECAAFPSVTPSIRAKTRLPVYDITDLCRFMMASVT